MAEAAEPGGYCPFVTSNPTGLTIPTLSNTPTRFSPGSLGSCGSMQVIYPITLIPTVFASMFSGGTYNGAPASPAVSTAAFKNEQC